MSTFSHSGILLPLQKLPLFTLMSSFESVSWKEKVDPLNKPLQINFYTMCYRIPAEEAGNAQVILIHWFS